MANLQWVISGHDVLLACWSEAQRDDVLKENHHLPSLFLTSADALLLDQSG